MSTPSPLAQKIVDGQAHLGRPPAAGIDQAQFELLANQYARRSVVDGLPALITADEAKEINVTYKTGAAKLRALTDLRNVRATRWDEMLGNEPFQQLTPEERAAATKYFLAAGIHPPDRSKQPEPPPPAPAPTRLAPPNPLKPAPGPELTPAEVERRAIHAAAQARADAAANTVRNAAAVAIGIADAQARNAALDKGIADAEAASKPAPTTAPAPSPQAPAAAAPIALSAHVEIEFTDAQGFRDRLTLYPGTSEAQIDALLKKASAARLALKNSGATAPTPAVAPAAKVPMCPVHHKKMKESRKPGTWFCPVKDPDTDEYCDEKVTQ